VKVKLADGKARTLQHMSATTFWSADGKPMSAAQFLETLFGALPEFFRDEDQLRALWSAPDTRRKLLEGLADKCFGKEPLAEMQKVIEAQSSDLFDVLAYVAFALAPGQSTALIGANGSGKSTLLKCLIRLIEPTEGRIEMLGRDVRALGPRDLRAFRAQVGIVWQRHNLVPRLCALSNVVHGVQARRSGPRVWFQALAPADVRAEAMACLDRVGLADRALTRLGVDNLGLDGADRRYMLLLAEHYGGGPVGVETISAALSESRDAVEEVIEPYLLQQGLIQRTPRGRMLAARAWRHLGLDAPRAPSQSHLFDG
jgi:ABC-type iron transport system FetAB ATPase subunit